MTPNTRRSIKRLTTISDIQRHFDLIQVKDGIATPQAVKQSYLTPLSGKRKLTERKQNFEISEAIDEMVNVYIAYCDKIKKAHKDGCKPCGGKNSGLPAGKKQDEGTTGNTGQNSIGHL